MEQAESRNRRERELASLYATARALTVLGDVDSVLAAVVRHAHELMGTDLTYLSVLGEDNSELTLRALEGSISPRFRTARVPATTGVGGQVIAHGSPFWVSSYLNSPELPHDQGFDHLVKDEGILALLGVPLRANGTVTGILYAADREERPFTPDEVALLSAFADHAAVALENARLYAESKAALAELQAAYQTIEAQVAMTERASQVHEALTRVVLSGGGAAEVAALLVNALEGRVTILNREDAVLVSRARPGDPPLADLPSLGGLLAESRRTGRCVGGTGDDGVRQSFTAILAGDSYLGAVVLSHQQELGPIDVRTLERAAQIVGLLTLKQDAVVEAEERVRRDLLSEILNSPRPPSPELLARGTARNVDLTQIDAIMVVRARAARGSEVTRALHALSGQWCGLAGEYLGTPALLLRAGDMDLAARSVYRSLRQRLGTATLVCASPVDIGSGDPGRAFTLAERCSQVLLGLGLDDRPATTGQFGIYSLLFDPARADELRTFIGDSLGPVLDYDHARGTDLTATLAAYFEHSGNVTQTAKAIHVHINTLLKRLDRITRVLGEQWREPDCALRLHFATRLHQLARDLDI